MTNAQKNFDRVPRHRVAQMSIEACKNDDIALMAEAIAISPYSEMSEQELLDSRVRSCLRFGLPRMLSYLLSRGADVERVQIWPLFEGGCDRPDHFFEMLEILMAHGWDVSSRGPDGSKAPLLWWAIEMDMLDLVEWCLAHGARVVYLPDDAPGTDDAPVTEMARPWRGSSISPILEDAAVASTVATFERLRSFGAPLGLQTLHRAVQAARYAAPVRNSLEENIHASKYEALMEMVRHLVEVVGLDVNIETQCLGSRGGTPLCHALESSSDRRELIWYLLDHGADPWFGNAFPSAMEVAMRYDKMFADAVVEWEVRHGKITPSRPSPPEGPISLCLEACTNDDKSLMNRAICLASLADSPNTVQEVVDVGLKRSVFLESIHVLHYLLTNTSADVRTLTSDLIIREPSGPILKMLLVAGWKRAGPGAAPL